MSTSLPREDRMNIISLLSDFEHMCEERGVLFGQYTESQLMEFLMLYKQYKVSKYADPPPF